MKDKGFWTGGAQGRSENGQSAGRPSGHPGRLGPKRAGVKTDLESTGRPGATEK